MEAEDREESPKPVGKTKERRAVRTERWDQQSSNTFLFLTYLPCVLV